MADSNSIDELFLQASELDGQERMAFLRTLPPGRRAKVSALLAADQSVAKKSFLGEAFQAKTPQSRDGTSKGVQQRRNLGQGQERSPRRASSSSRKQSRSVGKREPGRKVSQRSQSGNRAKQPNRRKLSHRTQLGYWLSGVAAIVVCSFLLWGIVSALKQTDAEKTTLTDFAPSTLDVDEPATEVMNSDLQSTSNPVAISDSAEAVGPKLFFTAAIEAPPLTPQQLKTLPNALSEISLVTNPRQLPSIRSWTLETINFRSYQGPIALSRDGQFVAFASQDRNIRIINYRTGLLSQIIELETDNAFTLKWGRSNSELFVASHKWNPSRTIIRRLDLETGRATHQFENSEAVFSLTSDRMRIYTVREQKLVVLNASDLSVVETLSLTDEADGLYLSPNGKHFLTNSGKSVSIYQNSRPLKRLNHVERECSQTSHAWSVNGRVSTGWTDGQMIVYDANLSGAPAVAAVQVFADKRFVRCDAWLSDDVALANGGGGDLRFVDVDRQKVVKIAGRKMWHSKLCYSSELGIGVIATDGKLRRLVGGEPKETLIRGTGVAADSVSISSDGRYLTTARAGVSCIDLSNGQRKFLVNAEIDSAIQEVVWSSDNQLLCKSGATVAMFNRRGSDSVRIGGFDLGERKIAQMIWALKNTSALIRCEDGSVMLCQLGTSIARRLPTPSDSPIRAITWNDVKNVAVLVTEEMIYEWSPDTNLSTVVADTPEGCANEVLLNATGTHLAFSGAGVVILDAADYSQVVKHDWDNASVRWLSADELMVLIHGGGAMQKLSLARPNEALKVKIPFSKYSAWNVSTVLPFAAATIKGNYVRLIDTRNGAQLGTIVPIDEIDYGTISADGRIIGASDRFLNKVVYQLKTDSGQVTLSPAEFSTRFGKYLGP